MGASRLPFFRSGEMTTLGEKDALLIYDQTGITSFFDLRTHHEIELFGKPNSLSKAGIKWLHEPMNQIDDPFFVIKVPSAKDYGLFYQRMLPCAIERVNSIISHFNRQLSPVAFGCGAGKDRTGVVAALLLKLLDYSDEVIIEEHIYSAHYILEKIDYFIERYKPQDVPADLYREQMLSKKESISLLLSCLEQDKSWYEQIDLEEKTQFKNHLKTLC